MVIIDSVSTSPKLKRTTILEIPHVKKTFNFDII